MGVNLITSAKDKEYKEKINARNTEYLKKHGRIGTSIFLFLAVGFLFKGIPIAALWCLRKLPAPIIFEWFKLGEHYQLNNSLKDIYTDDAYETGLLLFICLMSLASTLLITVGLYLFCFNKRILRTKLKPFNLLFVGIIFGAILGFVRGFWLLS